MVPAAPSPPFALTASWSRTHGATAAAWSAAMDAGTPASTTIAVMLPARSALVRLAIQWLIASLLLAIPQTRRMTRASGSVRGQETLRFDLCTLYPEARSFSAGVEESRAANRDGLQGRRFDVIIVSMPLPEDARSPLPTGIRAVWGRRSWRSSPIRPS